MTLEEYIRLDATALAELVRQRHVTPKELVTCARAMHDAVNPVLNAVIEFYSDAEDLSGPMDGAFSGVPFLRKDLGATEAGRLSEMGCRLFKGNIAEVDSYYTRRTKAAGLRYVGRTATPELGISGVTESALNGITRNPWNLERSAGGSSGGAASAVAAGIVPMAQASDGGGSTRTPAAWCGLVGLNPSRGRVSSGPGRSDPLFGLAREFVVCRSVRDMAAMLDVLSGPEPGDPFVILQPERPYLSELERPTGIFRIGVARSAWASMPISAEVLAEVDRIAALLADMGHLIEEIRCPIDPQDLMVGVMGAFNFDLVGLRNEAAALGRQIGLDTLEPVTLKLLELTEAMSPAQVGNLFTTLDKIRSDVARSTSQYDILLTPTLPVVAPEHGLYSTNHPTLSAEEYMANDPMLFGFQGTFNVTGQPAVSLPTGSSASGLPIGIQLVAAFGDEAALIRLSRDLSEASPWGEALPAIVDQAIQSVNAAHVGGITRGNANVVAEL